MSELEKAARELVEGAELMDGDIWGYLVGVATLDRLRAALPSEEDEVRPDGPETDKGGLIGQQPY